MKWLIFTILLVLNLSSCGQELKNRRVSSEGSEENVFQVQDCQETSGTVCGQPPMPVCDPGMACIQVFPSPQNYANECEMKAANAEFIQNGSCPSTTL